MMAKRKFRVHPLTQIAGVTGLSILALAYFSKRVLPEPLSYLELAFPPFLAVVYEAAAKSRPSAFYSRPVFGILAILLATVLVIAFNA